MLDGYSLIVAAIVLAVIYLYRIGRRPPGLPPGPPTIPFLGNLHLLFRNKRFHKTSRDLGVKYNGMHSFQYGQYPGVTITDLAIAKEAFIDHADIFSDRATHLDFNRMFLKEESIGVALLNGESWKQLRRLTLQSMRDMGVGKITIEQRIDEEFTELAKEIEKHDGKYFTFDIMFNKAASNIISAVLFNKRFCYDDKEFIQQVHCITDMVAKLNCSNLFNFLPWWTFILMPIVQPGIVYFVRHVWGLRAWIQRNVEDHKETFDEQHLRDFVDIYLQDQQTSENKFYNTKQVFDTMSMLFAGGTETTNTTLLWAMVFLTKYPDVQTKCRQELTKNVGHRRLSYKEKEEVPYLRATLHEVMRLCPTASVTLVNKVSQHTTLRGFVLPEDTLVNINIYAIHMDPKLWDEPHKFRPERFLDENGRFFIPEGFLPFGLGKRTCIGEPLAKMELLLFLAHLLQTFEFRAEDQSKLPSPDTAPFHSLPPGVFYVKAIKLT